jgi:Tfp pilus assembly protein PilX
MPRVSKFRRQPARPRRRKVRRRGAALAAVLVCLLVIMLLCGTLARGLLLRQRQSKTEAMQLQALWLAESAAALAVEQLHADPDYTGQTWRATIEENSASIGIAEIDVVRVDAQPRQRIVHIKSTYPDDPIQRVVLENEIAVTLPALGDSE